MVINKYIILFKRRNKIKNIFHVFHASAASRGTSWKVAVIVLSADMQVLYNVPKKSFTRGRTL